MNNIKRKLSIDQFRGFAIVLMMIINYLALYPIIPSFLKHTIGDGYTIADIIAPLFLFIIGIFYRKSLIKRINKYGRLKAYLYMAYRYIIIFLIGFIAGLFLQKDILNNWGILQAIGFSGLIVLPFMEWNKNIRIMILILILVFNQLIIQNFLSLYLINSNHGGPIGTLMWSSFILFPTVINDDRGSKNTARTFFILGLLFLSFSLLLNYFIKINKELLSVSYVTISIGISSIIYCTFIIVSDIFHMKIPSLSILGKNALFIFICHYIIIKICHYIIIKDSSILIILLGLIGIFFSCYLIAFLLDKKKIILKL